MQWENLTAADFEAAVDKTGVCVVNVAVVEKHGEHLPLGTDLFLGHRLACLAAERESAVVFPPYYFGKVYEAMCFPGTIAIKPALLIELAQNVFDEIGRNGFKKIIVANSHGGNWHLLNFLAQCNISEEKPYALYVPQHFLHPELNAAHESICPAPSHEHAGQIETSVAHALFPDLVHQDRVPHKSAEPLGRLDHLRDILTGVKWYADFPDHYAGDAASASAQDGEALVELYVDSLAKYIAAVKADVAVRALTTEFYDRVRGLGGE